LGWVLCLLASVTPIAEELPPRLLQPLSFRDFTVTGEVTPAGAARLLHKPVKIGTGDPAGYAFLSRDGGTTYVRVETGAEYLAAWQSGARPVTTFDLAMDSWFQTTAGTLVFLQRCQPATNRFLPGHLLANLPVTILDWHGDEERLRLERDGARGRRLADYWRTGRLRRWQSTPEGLRFRFKAQDYQLTELARGDWNGDGQEDVLVAMATHYLHGTGRSYRIFVAERLGLMGRTKAFEFDLGKREAQYQPTEHCTVVTELPTLTKA
jgi:hypothetical protein